MALGSVKKVPTLVLAGVLLTSTLVTGAGSPATAATTVTRYASPAGSGSLCTRTAPCDLVEAVNEAPDGAVVILKPGQYGSRIGPINQTVQSNGTASGPNHIVIHGQFGKPAPTIFLGDTGMVTLNGSSIDYVHIVHIGSRVALLLRDASANRVQVDSDGSVACQLLNATISNTVCADQGHTAVLIDGDGFSNAGTLRNVTAVSSGSGSYGLLCSGENGGSCSALVVNTIADASFDVEADAYGDGTTATINAFNSDFLSAGSGTSGTGTSSVNTDDSDITGAPVFVDAANGDFREAASSPTIDAGLDDGAQGTTDAGGLPRKMGSAVDIGAFEFPVAATISNVQVVRVRKHSIHVTAVVDTQGLAATARLLATHHGSTTTTKAQALPAQSKPTKVSLIVSDLKRHTRYALRVKVKDIGGITTSPAVHARTH